MDTDCLELITWNYIRTQYENANKIHIPVALKYLMKKFAKKMFTSNILTFKQDLEFFAVLSNKLNDKILHKKLKLLYRSSEHNYTASSFHKHCDGHGPTITIIKSNHGNIFGGYAPIKWPDSTYNAETYNKNIFLFLIHSNDTMQKYPIIFDAYKSGVEHIESHSLRAVIFGSGATRVISIGDKCNESSLDVLNGYTSLCYTCKIGADFDFEQLNESLCGAPASSTDFDNNLFRVLDYEVFEIL